MKKRKEREEDLDKIDDISIKIRELSDEAYECIVQHMNCVLNRDISKTGVLESYFDNCIVRHVRSRLLVFEYLNQSSSTFLK
jgi:hypothetical protein